MPTPLASVCMVTYNHEPYIAQAIEGALHQETDFPFEIVVGEDCSTDRTGDIVAQLQREHPDTVRVTTSSQNVGSCANNLRTERACRGEFVAYCEGDDYWHDPRKLQKQVAFLRANPSYGLIHSDVNVEFVETGRLIHAVDRTTRLYDHDDGDVYLGLLAGTYHVWTPSACVRKDLLEQIVAANPSELQQSRFMMGDKPRWLELARITQFKYLDEPTATYRQLGESASHSRDARRRVLFEQSALEMHLHYLRKYGCPQKTFEACLHKRYAALLALAYESANGELARHAIREMRRTTGKLTLASCLALVGAQSAVARSLLAPLAFLWRETDALKCLGRMAVHIWPGIADT
jgi:glycosyltransferase involved in cell wall biosynthesis